MTLSPLLLALTLAAAPRVAVLVHTSGFSDDDDRRIGDKTRAEAAATGLELWALAGAVEVKPECLEDRACAVELLRTADAAWLVSLNVLRAGGQASLSAVLIDVDGKVAAEAQGVRKVELVLGEGALLGAEILAPLRQAARESAPPPSPTPPVPSPDAPTAEPPTPLAPEPAPAPPEEPAELSGLALGGVAALGVGAIAAVAGGAVVAAQFGVLNDPSSLREEKEQAALVLIPAMGTVALVGVAVTGLGGALLWLGLQES